MAAFDLQEQEQLEELKAFWAKWGYLISALILGVILAYVGNKGWHVFQAHRAQQAAEAFSKVEAAFEAHDAAKTRAAADEMVAQQPGHALSARAMLLAARTAFDAKDLDHAKSALQWVIANAKDDNIVDMASLRLAAVLVDQKQYDAALQTVQTSKTKNAAGLFDDARGDILLVKGDTAGAKKAFQDAASKLEKENPAYQLVQTKLSALGA